MRDVTSDPVLGAYPEVDAGGFTRVDGTIAFYTRVRAVLADRDPRATVVLDFGAGRGKFFEDPVPYRRRLRHLQDVATVVGVDVDPVVLTNPCVDQAYVIDDGGQLPLDDGSVDLIVSDYTFEHLRSPEVVAKEFDRVLRSGGWVCIRTPNGRGLIALAARIVPNRFHHAALRVLQPSKDARDTFPTAYRANTVERLAVLFPPDRFDVFGYTHDPEPAYAGGSRVLAGCLRLVARLTPERWRAILLAFVRKRPGPE